MPRSNRFAFALLPVLLAAAASVGCSSSEASSGFSDTTNAAPPNMSSPGDENGGSFNQGSAERAIAEADIVQLASGRLYAMSKSGTLSIIDVSQPARLTMLGQAYLPGEPFEMYLRGDLLVVMTNGAYSSSGQANAPVGASAGQGSGAEATVAVAPRDPNAGAGVMVINVKDPGLMQRVASFQVPGEIADSRVVGDILYLVTYESSYCYGCGATPRTTVTTFDVATPQSMRQVDQATFESGEQYDVGWGSPGYKRSVLATTERLYVGGHGEATNGRGGPEGFIDVLDITDPTGKLGKGAHIETTGAILNRWQMDEKDGVLRVISQRGIGYLANGAGSPEVQTFHIWNTRSMQLVGNTALALPRQEGLKSVRFDGDRAYAITFNQSDPLFVIDLANEAAPKQRGELHMPGWVFHLEPHGDRVLGLGLDRNDTKGHLNVSLFDVVDMDHPQMLARVAFGPTGFETDHSIVSYELPEDQDRIQKAFRVFDDGLIAVPFSGGESVSNGLPGCAGLSGGIQLIDWTGGALAKRATLPVAGNPRRALQNQGELLAVSDSNVTSFDITRRDVAYKTADLVIGSCEARSASPANRQFGNDRFVADDDFSGGLVSCSSSGNVRSGSSLGIALTLGLGAALVRRRRRHG